MKIATAAATPSSVMGAGLMVEGQKYLILRAEDTSIYGKKARRTPLLPSSSKPVFRQATGERVDGVRTGQ